MKGAALARVVGLAIIGFAAPPADSSQAAILRFAQVAESPAPSDVELARVAESELARQHLVAWFECEECTDRELENVVEHGDDVVPSLAAALQKGVSPSKREEISRHLRETHRVLVEYARKHEGQPSPMREDEYVRMYLSNAEALYRSRSATALIKIGTPAARRALAGGLKVDSLRPEVRERIEAALAE